MREKLQQDVHRHSAKLTEREMFCSEEWEKMDDDMHPQDLKL